MSVVKVRERTNDCTVLNHDAQPKYHIGLDHNITSQLGIGRKVNGLRCHHGHAIDVGAVAGRELNVDVSVFGQ